MTKQELLDAITFVGYSSIMLNGDYLNYGVIAKNLYPDVEWFFDEQEGSYQGDWYMVGKDKEGKYYFFTMSYGSCSGCDWLESIASSGPDGKEEMGELIDKILNTPILENKEAALEYAKKFDWQNSYDREENNPFVKEVVEAIEKS